MNSDAGWAILTFIFGFVLACVFIFGSDSVVVVYKKKDGWMWVEYEDKPYELVEIQKK